MDQPGQPFIPIEEQLRIIADKAPVLIWMSGTDKRCYFFNASWLKFTGRTFEQELGNGWTEGVHPDDLESCFATYNSAFEAREEFKMEYRLRRYDGKYQWVLDHGIPFYRSNEEFSGYIGSCIVTDELLGSALVKRNFISAEAFEIEQSLNEELATMNEELAASNEELVAINEELHQAQYNLHQLNNKLEEKVEARTKALAESEKLFRSIALNIPRSLIIVIDREHRYKIIEGDIMEKMGYDRKNYEGKHPADLSSERYEASRHLYERMFAGEHFSVERKADTGEDYMVHFVPLKNGEGDVDNGLIIALDISDIKQAEEKSAKLAAIIASTDDAIISKTLESVITSWNESATRIFGYTADEIIGETIYKLIPPGREQEEPHILSRLKNGERVEHFETQRITKDGRLIDVSVTVSPVKDTQGRIIGLSKIARDITERKLEETRKNDFIGMVSHELKTPLTTLNAIIQVANTKLNGSDDRFLATAMQKANAQVKKMTAMINGFLNVSRLEASRIQIEKETFDLGILFEEILEETRLIVHTHEIILSECSDLYVHADREKISSVLSNLISNAVKYSPQGKLVRVECLKMANEIVVSVADEGMGISAENIGQIFDRYYRIETDNTRHISGFGIGLYLSAEIVKLHQGRIWAESQSGKGSTFYFSLPLVG